MSVIAENAKHLIDDTLARRNAMVLAVTQALAGGNNTIRIRNRYCASSAWQIDVLAFKK